jgi:hypothetical protein
MRIEEDQQSNQRKRHLQRNKLLKQILVILQDLINKLLKSKKNSKIKINSSKTTATKKNKNMKVEAVTSVEIPKPV